MSSGMIASMINPVSRKPVNQRYKPPCFWPLLSLPLYKHEAIKRNAFPFARHLMHLAHLLLSNRTRAMAPGREGICKECAPRRRQADTCDGRARRSRPRSAATGTTRGSSARTASRGALAARTGTARTCTCTRSKFSAAHSTFLYE